MSNGARTPVGIGHVIQADLLRIAEDRAILSELRGANETTNTIIGALDAASDVAHRKRMIDRYRTLLTANVLRNAGLVAPAKAT